VPKPLAFDPIDEAARQWEQHWGPDTVPPMALVTSIMRGQQILLARLDEVLRPYDLRFARYEALMLLFYSRAGRLPVGKIGARLQVHPTSVTPLVERLERAGYAVREPHPTDRRTTLVSITDAGRDVARRATAELNERLMGTRPLEREDMRAITDALRKLRLDAGDFAPSDE
jgi:DNA-binding MarR family transcriptional regulator